MSDEFALHTDISWNGNVGTVNYGSDKNMVVLFYTKAVQNPQKSLEHGRPFYEDVTYVKIHPPGERLNIVDRPANASDKRRWPIQWMQFSENREQHPEGTPVDLMYPDQPAVAATLRANNIYTIEQCAELSGDAIETVGMGAQRYVNDAKKYLEAANKGVGAAQLRKELEERDGMIRTLEHKITLMAAEISRMREEKDGAVAGLPGDVQQLQRLLGSLLGANGQRAVFPDTKEPPKSFDAQSAQINATHVTQDIATQKTKRPRQRIKS